MQAADNGDNQAALLARIEELQRERDHLVAVVDILQAVSGSIHFSDIVQTIARKLGETFGLDRSSIFLASASEDVRLVATYEDPSIRNLMVDLTRYPELEKVFNSGETVFIADAADEPMLQDIRPLLDLRNVRSIVVAPIRWRSHVIGAIVVRTERDAPPFSPGDVHFVQAVASLTATALRNAHRVESMLRAVQDSAQAQRRSELERIALLAFAKRLFSRFGSSSEQTAAETLLSKRTDSEIERLITTTLESLAADTPPTPTPR
jgi:GAF domain-containing protein